MYQIEIANQQDRLEIDEDLIRLVATKTLETEATAAAEISIAIVDDPTIHQLNRQHLNHDYPTDVLSFLFDCELEEDFDTGRSGIRQNSSDQAGGEEFSQIPRTETADATHPRGRHKSIDGEIIVSTETAIAKAAELQCDAHHELLLYVIHGLLHLIGYDDIDDKERVLMRSREKAILDICQLTPGVDS